MGRSRLRKQHQQLPDGQARQKSKERGINMGLDMHLIRAPRLDDVTIQQINAAEGWFSYENRPEAYKSSKPSVNPSDKVVNAIFL